MEKAELVKEMTKLTETTFSAASKEDISNLRSLGLPDQVVDFYAKYEPDDCAEGQVRIWPIEDIIAENCDLMPGAYIAPHGYIVFATNEYGNAYCFNVNKCDEEGNPEVVLVSHEMVYEDMPLEEVAPIVKPIAKNLNEFLHLFIRGEIDEDCIE